MISVCLTSFNGESFILEQLKSILCQLNNEDEVIISDDGSTDKTIEMINGLNEKRIKLISNTNEKGIISNIENSLKNAKGDIIFLADQDDIWLPDKINVCTKALETSDLVITDCFVTDKNLNISSNSFFTLNNSKRNKWRALLKNPYLGCCMAFNRKVLNDALPFPSNLPMHDIWLGNVAAFRHKVKFIDDKLIYYRRHGLNLSTASETSKATIFEQLKFRTSIIQALIKLRLKSKR